MLSVLCIRRRLQPLFHIFFGSRHNSACKVGKRNREYSTNIHLSCDTIKIHSGTLSRTPAATLYTAPSTHAAYASWGQEIMISTSQSISLRTRNVVIDGRGSITLARVSRHGQNGSLQHRSSVGGTPREPKVKIRQQKESPTERMRMYSCTMDLEVEDKSGHFERLV
jgi:hypothetical protein